MKPPKKPARHLRFSDIRGIAQLATQATTGVTQVVEGVHRSVLRTVGLPGAAGPGPTSGVTGFVYKSIHGVTRFVGTGTDLALASLQPLFRSADNSEPGSPEREAILAALNGMAGDRMVEGDNPLVIPMSLRYRGQALNWDAAPDMAAATGKVLVLIHGLCVSDASWSRKYQGRGVNYGEVLGRSLGYTPVYLRYNSGLHISTNARELSDQLERLVTHWPVAVTELSVVAHSMGGLLARSAYHYGAEASRSWTKRTKRMVFLGTPHHGAPLEQAGGWADTILGSTPYSAPFRRLGRLRSAGITDLRFGNVLDEDWQGHDRFVRRADSRRPLTLPAGVRCFAVAATAAARRGTLADRLIGDGLVPLDSALGAHKDSRRSLKFSRDAQHVVYRKHHMDLLSNPAVSSKLVRWLGS